MGGTWQVDPEHQTPPRQATGQENRRSVGHYSSEYRSLTLGDVAVPWVTGKAWKEWEAPPLAYLATTMLCSVAHSGPSLPSLQMCGVRHVKFCLFSKQTEQIDVKVTITKMHN